MRDLESDCDVTISMTSFISSDECDTDKLGVNYTIFEGEELEYNEIIYVELMRELDSDRPHDFHDLFYQVTEITTAQSLFMPRVSSVNNFRILVFLGLENDEINTKIVFNCVICIDEITQVTEIVTSQSLSKSRASST